MRGGLQITDPVVREPEHIVGFVTEGMILKVNFISHKCEVSDLGFTSRFGIKDFLDSGWTDQQGHIKSCIISQK